MKNNRLCFSSLSFVGLAMAIIFGMAGCTHAQKDMAHATLKDGAGKVIGHASLTAMAAGVKIDLKVSGLPAGSHAFHIHGTGSCIPPDFKSAGGHFNPANKQHGRNNPAGHHAGDLNNLVVGADGTGSLSVLVPDVSLSTDQPNGLLGVHGTALVLHALADDNVSDPTGNAGSRIACGVIQRGQDVD